LPPRRKCSNTVNPAQLLASVKRISREWVGRRGDDANERRCMVDPREARQTNHAVYSSRHNGYL